MRDAVLLNAGAALAVHAAEAGSLDERLAAGIARARDAVDAGRGGGHPGPVGPGQRDGLTGGRLTRGRPDAPEAPAAQAGLWARTVNSL